MNGALDVKPFDEDSKNTLNVIVETPKGGRVKYSYDLETGFFKLSKALPAGMAFPFNFGFVPQTEADDGDPLDILILNEEPLTCGCLLKVRVIAVIKVEQQEEKKWIRNDRIVGEAIGKEVPLEFKGMKLEPKALSQIEFFFKTYNKLYGKKIRVSGTAGPRKAMTLVKAAARQHQTTASKE